MSLIKKLEFIDKHFHLYGRPDMGENPDGTPGTGGGGGSGSEGDDDENDSGLSEEEIEEFEKEYTTPEHSSDENEWDSIVDKIRNELKHDKEDSPSYPSVFGEQNSNLNKSPFEQAISGGVFDIDSFLKNPLGFEQKQKDILKGLNEDPDRWGIYDDGIYIETVKVGSYHFTYDRHISKDGTQYGIAAEIVADISESVFNERISDSTAATIDLLAKGIALVISLSSVPTTMTMLSSGTITLQIAGALSLSSTFTDLQDFAEFINRHFADPNSAVLMGMMDFETGGGIDTSLQLALEEKRKYQLELNTRINFINLLLTNGYGKYLAGGSVYQGVFAGGDYFDATTPPDTSFCTGKIYSMSEHAKRIHAPYAHFLPHNMAGKDNFSVLG